MGMSGLWARMPTELCRENVAVNYGHNRTRIPLSGEDEFRLPRRRPVIYMGSRGRGEGDLSQLRGVWVSTA